MSKKNYTELLKDPRWQKRRLLVMEYAGFRCQICGDSTTTLHCHHSYYARGKKPWEYPDGAIICVCADCHAMLHPKPLVHVATQDDAGTPLSKENGASKFAEIFAMLKHL